MRNTRTNLKKYFLPLFICSMIGQVVFAQPQYKLHISNIIIPEDTRNPNWLGRPTQNDFIVRWELYEADEAGNVKRVDSSGLLNYRLYWSKDDDQFLHQENYVSSDADTAVLSGQEVDKRYYFRVDGYDIDNDALVVQSDIAWATGGKPGGIYAAPESAISGEKEKKSFPFPLFFPVAEFFSEVFNRQNEVYYKSGPFGKIAFTLLWYIWIFSLVYIIPFRSAKQLYIGRIFPFKGLRFFKSYFGRDQNHDKYTAPRFRFVLEAWKRVIDKTSEAVLERNGDANKENPCDDEGIESIDKKFYDYFKINGAPALKVLKAALLFNPKNSDQEDKGELKRNIKKYFGEGAVFGDIITKPLKITTRDGEFQLTWPEVSHDLFDSSAGPMVEYPTVQILAAGLQNHITNGSHWQHVSEEVDRAIENRANSEIELLKEKSGIEWLWNLGALSPLIGLFGTVTGITRVFGEIRGMEKTTTQLELVEKLSSGIFEALWTTIYGLMAGIVLMMIFYYFKNILDWIANKWQDLAVSITEKL
ncbi:MotA/TolQ/ExbB proton channel family protein [candidate division KSB1 bacterium]|nr:MotA/TolQ/ExbB proton channel family protein [candidate division KSB1 bacterium]RQW06838.1 MAG: MotA/TolQ/ExbB proton channel family protein [candidate division KSB1 bacterium]